jgi:hypothetical protein
MAGKVDSPPYWELCAYFAERVGDTAGRLRSSDWPHGDSTKHGQPPDPVSNSGARLYIIIGQRQNHWTVGQTEDWGFDLAQRLPN